MSRFAPPFFYLQRDFLSAAILAPLLLTCFFVNLGQPKPASAWNWVDIISDAGAALLVFAWLLVILSSRPRGRVTSLLSCGLLGIMLSCWADCLDEFFAIPKPGLWAHLVESGCMLAGMLSLSLGLWYWRHEQLMLNRHLQKRERLLRNQHGFDHITQLASCTYLHEQIALELKHAVGGQRQPCSLILFDFNQFHDLNRRYGFAEGDRLLQAVSHLLLLNIRNQDLLCRYAGDRLALLLPGTGLGLAHAQAAHLCKMVMQLRHYTCDGQLLGQSMRFAGTLVDAPAEELLARLQQELQQESRQQQSKAAIHGQRPVWE